ncbi:unnamed protein product [Auanema sp. JU1783]|nr:unnamed protein product [Auanema sp. JU1783]
MTRYGLVALKVGSLVQCCFLFLIAEKSITLGLREDLPEKDEQPEFRYFYIGLFLCSFVSFISVFSISISAFLPYNVFKKKLVVISNYFQLLITIPFLISGLYLAFHEQQYHLNDAFEQKHLQGTNDSSVWDSYQFYCCCGWNADANVSFCESKTCIRPCSSIIPEKHKRFAKYFSYFLSFSALLILLSSPFHYAIFENERRIERAKFIRTWQKKWKLNFRLEKNQLSDDLTQYTLSPTESLLSTMESTYAIDKTQKESSGEFDFFFLKSKRSSRKLPSETS